MVFLYVYGSGNRWGCTLRHPASGNVMTHTGEHPTLSGNIEMIKLAIHVGTSLLKYPCHVQIYGMEDVDLPNYEQIQSSTELKLLEFRCSA